MTSAVLMCRPDLAELLLDSIARAVAGGDGN